MMSVYIYVVRSDEEMFEKMYDFGFQAVVEGVVQCYFLDSSPRPPVVLFVFRLFFFFAVSHLGGKNLPCS